MLNEKIRQIPSVAGVIEQLVIQSQQIDETVMGLINCLKSQLEIRKIVSEYKASRGLATTRPFSSASVLSTPRVSQPAGPVNIERILISFHHENNELQAMKIRNELEKRDYSAALIERKSSSSSTQKLDFNSMVKSICKILINLTIN